MRGRGSRTRLGSDFKRSGKARAPAGPWKQYHASRAVDWEGATAEVLKAIPRSVPPIGANFPQNPPVPASSPLARSPASKRQDSLQIPTWRTGRNPVLGTFSVASGQIPRPHILRHRTWSTLRRTRLLQARKRRPPETLPATSTRAGNCWSSGPTATPAAEQERHGTHALESLIGRKWRFGKCRGLNGQRTRLC